MVHLVPFTLEHAGELSKIIEANYREVLAPFYSPEAVEHSIRFYHTPARLVEAAEKARMTPVALEGTAILGMGQLMRREDQEGRLFICRVYMDIPAQGKGIGRLLMQALESKAREEAEEVWLYAVIHPRTLLFYQQLGYQTVEHKDFALPHGGVFPCELMVKKL